MTSTYVRPLQEREKPEWQRLWNAYQRFYGIAVPPPTSARLWRHFANPDSPIFALGAFAGNSLVGIAHFVMQPSTWTLEDGCYLHDLFTDEAHRSTGVGASLIEAGRAEARRRGASRLSWLTHETNLRAMRLYDSIAVRTGFVHYGLKV